MKFIIAVLILVGAQPVMSNLTEGTGLFDAASLVIVAALIYVLYKVFKFVFGAKSSDATTAPTTTKVEAPKHERRPMINAQGTKQIVRQERLGFEKWKVVYGTFGPNGQRNEIGSTILSPSIPTFSSGRDNFSVTWA